MLIYLYCITDKEPNLNGSIELVSGLYFIDEQGLYAVASKEKEDEFSEENLKKNLSNLDWVKAKATAHERVIEEVMKDTCVVPFKFATLFNTEKSLKTMLNEHEQEFKENLIELAGKEEWGIKIYCDKERLKESLNINNEELLKIDQEISSASPGKAFILKKKREELLEIILNKSLNQYVQESFNQLGRYCQEGRLNRVLPREATGRNEDMILNAAYLVAKDKVARFNQEADRLNSDGKEKGISFDLSGPWPPYNFCQPLSKKTQNE